MRACSDLHSFPTRRSSDLQVAVLEQSECVARNVRLEREGDFAAGQDVHGVESEVRHGREGADRSKQVGIAFDEATRVGDEITDRKSTRLNSSHANISYAVF